MNGIIQDSIPAPTHGVVIVVGVVVGNELDISNTLLLHEEIGVVLLVRSFSCMRFLSSSASVA